MKKKVLSLCLALVLCLSLTVPAAATDQKIVAGGVTYEAVLQALLAQGSEPVTLLLESDIQLTDAVVLGTSDYGGLFGGQELTVASHDITIDLNGHTLTGENDCAVFEIQSGYTLTIVDSSAAKTGKVVSQGEAVMDVKEGGTYHPLPEGPTEEPPASIGSAGESSSSQEPAAPANPFTDVAEASPYYQGILWAVESGVTNGTTATTFSPNKACTRAQIAVFLWRAAGSPEPALTESNYVDVTDPSAYYYKAVQWAAEMDMEFRGTFRPNDPCTRFDAVYFIWRANGSPAPKEKAQFADMEPDGGQPLHPVESVYWAVEAGVTKGTGDGTTFSPGASCTRGQIATFLHRAAQAGQE